MSDTRTPDARAGDRRPAKPSFLRGLFAGRIDDARLRQEYPELMARLDARRPPALARA